LRPRNTVIDVQNGLPPTLVERAVADQRRLVIAALLAIVVPCWIWIGAMAADMYGTMTGASAWSMTLSWGWRHTVLLFAMWVAMMAGMMLPSVAPVLLLYARVVRTSREAPATGRRVAALAAGYLTMWVAFSGAATLLQRVLASTAVMTPMMELESAQLSGVLLVVAGVYQLTPAKGRCLEACRSAMGVIGRFWQRGTSGAFRMGAHHGAYCLGCCWALMLLLFAGGVMNLFVVAGLTGLVLLEKLSRSGYLVARAAGVGFLVAGMWLLGS
jgi:predicted metal-binding membrane protein